MDLWIRSQDKESLTKVSNVQYTYRKGDLYNDGRGKHYIGTYYDNLKILGSYKSKERALEVLDEIHQRLINIQCLELTGADYISNQMKRNGVDCVYQMPEN